MIMLYPQYALNPIFYPKSIFCPLAFGAVPVLTTVVADMLLAALAASVFMSSQGRCPTFGQNIQGSQLPGVGMVFDDKGPGEPMDNIR
jgi:hypothetical protein